VGVGVAAVIPVLTATGCCLLLNRMLD